MVGKYKVITLCGSTRFKDAILYCIYLSRLQPRKSGEGESSLRTAG